MRCRRTCPGSHARVLGLLGSARMSLELRAWELAEAERSSCEADHTSAERLHADERQLARYMNPCPATAFPLEYAYALLGDVRSRLVLDFGCGSGENSLLLASRGARVIG